MKYFVFFITLFIFFKSIGYSIYEIKQKNRVGGYTVLLLASTQLIFTNYITFTLNR